MVKVSKIISVFALFALVLPTGVFASPQNQTSPAGNPAVFTSQLVRVVEVQTNQIVVPRTAVPEKNLDCAFNQTRADNSLQNAAAFNLNQPASCFSLTLGQLAPAPKLAVAIVRQSAKVIPLSLGRLAESPSFAPEPYSQSGVLPVAVFAIFSLILFEEKKSKGRQIISALKHIKSGLSLQQLGVLRC